MYALRNKSDHRSTTIESRQYIPLLVLLMSALSLDGLCSRHSPDWRHIDVEIATSGKSDVLCVSFQCRAVTSSADGR